MAPRPAPVHGGGVRLATAAALVLALAFAAPALAGDPAEEAASLASRLMSPFCPGRTLYSCSSQQAETWRRDIKDWLADGVSEEVIVARLQARVPGHDIRGVPSGPWYWGIPLLAVVAAGLFVARVTRKARRSRGGRSEEPAGEDPDLADRLDDELALVD